MTIDVNAVECHPEVAAGEIERLTRLLDETRTARDIAQGRAGEAIDQRRDAEERHKREVGRISDALLEFAGENDVEKEYAELLDDLNDQLLYKLKAPSREMRVLVTITFGAMVEASTEDEACETVDGDLAHYINRALQTWDYNTEETRVSRD